MPKSGPARKFKHHVTAWLDLEGGDRVEDLGIFEATTGQRARDAARAQNAEKLGIRQKRDGSWTGKWRVRSTPVRVPSQADQDGATKFLQETEALMPGPDNVTVQTRTKLYETLRAVLVGRSDHDLNDPDEREVVLDDLVEVIEMDFLIKES